jgi:hypothetical protein
MPGASTRTGRLFRLASEALRIRLAHLFDPYLALHTSNLDALPHQIRAVYGEMLPQQPLRFLLADDPGAGKTIMAGLLIKELIVPGNRPKKDTSDDARYNREVDALAVEARRGVVEPAPKQGHDPARVGERTVA